jgi:hypothetical protein
MLSVVTRPIRLSVVMLSVVMLSVVMLDVVMLSVVAPVKTPIFHFKKRINLFQCHKTFFLS